MLSKIVDFLKTQKSVYIITHVNPDGDALGSSFGLKFILEKIGVKAEVVLGGGLPETFEFTGWSPITEAEKADCVVGVDFGEVSRTPDSKLFENAGMKLIIDHHIVKSETGDMFFSDPQAAAAGEIIFRIMKLLGVKPDKKIAEALYIAIMTDTGGCRFGNTTKNTHLILAELIDLVDNAYINRMCFDIISRGKFEARKLLFGQMESYCDGKFNVFAADMRFKNEDDLNGLVNIAVNMEGAVAGAVLKQRDENTVKVSLRTINPLSAADICAHFGGGGHANAAGCTLTGNLDAVKKEFIDYLVQRIEVL